MTDTSPSRGSEDSPELHTTAFLLARMKAGDKRAVEILFERLCPVLRRIAHGRIPRRSRGIKETDDLVQVAVIRTIPHLNRFDSRGKGSLVAYARRIMMNELRDEYRRLSRTPESVELDVELPSGDPDPLQNAIAAEMLAVYRDALGQLTQDEQDHIILSLEMGLSHAEVAHATGRPSADAARMAVARALARLVERMAWAEEDL